MLIKQPNRREFIKTSLFAAAGTLSFFAFAQGIFGNRAEAKPAAKEEPLPAGSNEVSESDPVASAIGYKSDPSKIDFAKYPQRKKPEAKTQACKNCALFTSVNGSWGKCQMLTTGLVNSHGWCGSWSKKS